MFQLTIDRPINYALIYLHMVIMLSTKNPKLEGFGSYSFKVFSLLRFGVFLKPWGLKPTDDAKNLLYPIPNQALAANPNLTQNTGY